MTVDIDKAVAMWQAGEKVEDISRALKIGRDKFLRIRNLNPNSFQPRKTAFDTTVTRDKYIKAKRLWRDKHSMRAIADLLGVTKGAISGTMDRHRVDFPMREGSSNAKRAYSARSFPVKPKRTEDEKRASLSANKLRQMFNEAFNASVPLPKPKESNEAYDRSRLPGVSLFDLGKHQCIWPINDGKPFAFCAEAKSGKSYCPNHQQRAWRAM